MEVQLTPDQEEFIRKGMDEGRYKSADDAVRETMAHWEEAQRERLEMIAALEAGEADIEAGRYREYDADSSPGLAEELKREGREARGRLKDCTTASR
jgi:putative addiction module CopG family antidote